MFCPQCGITPNEALKFCNSCGANLYAVKQVVNTRETGKKIDFSKTWMADMLMSQDERQRRKEELERERRVSPEVKRYNEIKAGVMTSSVGIGVMAFLYVIAQGLIAAGMLPHIAVEILRTVWVAGVIPFFIGVGLFINGLVVSKRIVEAERREIEARERDSIMVAKEDRSLPSGGGSISPKFSVTENTTRRLEDSG
jgi:hypothetical protein